MIDFKVSPEHPFSISIPQSSLDVLQQKLALVNFPDEYEHAGWTYGAPLREIKRLVEYWRTSFDWRKSERTINEELPQFKREIEVTGFGMIGIHYVHKRSTVPNAIPLCFVHGWPGLFLEPRHLIPYLINGGPDAPSFHVVSLSLPNNGFSDGVKKPGFGLHKHAEVAHRLMLSLGYNEYVTQGGDWGYGITRLMAQEYGPTHVKAWHTNFPVPPPLNPITAPLKTLSALAAYFTPFTTKMRENQSRFSVLRDFYLSGSGYMQISSTKPQTLGYSLVDSPVGLLAWIYEKLVAWTDNYPWTEDQVLEWVSIFYFSTAGPAASVRIYYEAYSNGKTIGNVMGAGPKPAIPFGCSYFANDVAQFPKSWSRDIGHLVFESDHPAGGHYPSIEHTEAFANDLRNMFRRGSPAYGVVNGHTGYLI